VSTTPAWGMEPTTSSLGAMSLYHQAKACGASCTLKDKHMTLVISMLYNILCLHMQTQNYDLKYPMVLR
jgi:hypothetical protein